MSIFTVPDEHLKRALVDCRRIAATIAECVKTKVWSGYTKGVEPLELPAYAFNTSYVPLIEETDDGDEHPF